MSKFTVPTNLAVGKHYKNREFYTTIIAEIRMSSRAKNGIFTIPNGSAFRKKLVDGKYTRMKNEFKNGFKLVVEREEKGGRKDIVYFLLSHADFEFNIELSFEQYKTLLHSVNISKGDIMDELIYTSRGFLTAEDVSLYQKSYEMEKIKKEQARAVDRLYKKDIKAGDFCVTYNEKTGSAPLIKLYFGTLVTTQGEFHMLLDLHGVNITWLVDALILDKEWSFIKQKIFNKVRTPNLNSYTSPFTASFATHLQGVSIYLREFDISIRRNFPKFWKVPSDNPLRDLNIYDRLTIEQLDLAYQVLSKPPQFAGRYNMQAKDFIGIKELENIIDQRKTRIQEVEDASVAEK